MYCAGQSGDFLSCGEHAHHRWTGNDPGGFYRTRGTESGRGAEDQAFANSHPYQKIGWKPISLAAYRKEQDILYAWIAIVDRVLPFHAMTAQIPDSFLLRDNKYSIVGMNGTGLFHPVEYDLQPLPRITSCWRGFVTMYKILSNKLFLDTLQINLDHEGPVINNVRPVFSTQGMFNNLYNNLKLSVNFTGGLLIAAGFIQKLYVHMGFHPAWKYETVYELSFSEGDVLKTQDVSKEMAELRAKMTRKPLQPGADASTEEVDAWIASTFKRDYRS